MKLKGRFFMRKNAVIEPQNDFAAHEGIKKPRRRLRPIIIVLLLLIASGVVSGLLLPGRGNTLAEVGRNSDVLLVLDAGHGGKDVGANPAGVEEKKVNLAFTLGIGKQLKALGYKVRYTRDDDTFVKLAERASYANKHKAHLFISVHCNSSDSTSAQGIEVYYNGRSGASQLAEQVLASMTGRLKAKDRGCKLGNLAVLNKTEMPAILIETGFLSNAEERAKLLDKSYQDKLIAAVVSGIDAYIGEIIGD